MQQKFDPIYQLCHFEAVRFVGTIAEVLQDSLTTYLAICGAFTSTEVRSSVELQNLIMDRTNAKVAAAKNTIEVASSLRLISPVVQSGAISKYILGENGRVLNAFYNQKLSPDAHRRLLIRPMFEGHGDYLVQALTAISKAGNRQQAIELFTELIKNLIEAKRREVPELPQTLAWTTYRREIQVRQSAINGSSGSFDAPDLNTLEGLKQQRDHRLKILSGDSGAKVSQASEIGKSSKNFEHHYNRCRNWCEGLGLLQEQGKHYSLTSEGWRVLNYFHAHSNMGEPARIPPTAELLEDALQIDRDMIIATWGVAVDDAFWEELLIDCDKLGRYQPSEAEWERVFDWAFNSVRLPLVSQVYLRSLRTCMFYHWLLEKKPVTPEDMHERLNRFITGKSGMYGFATNRQGRTAYVFRK